MAYFINLYNFFSTSHRQSMKKSVETICLFLAQKRVA